jgi:hypothetical protein
MTKVKSHNFKLLLTLFFIVNCLLYTIYYGGWPEIFNFTSTGTLSGISKILQAPIHLSDDVMISLRSGYIFNTTGIPAFNRIDLAQPSTSYLAPYIYGIILKIFPSGGLPIILYAALGLFFVFLTYCTIGFFALSKLNATFVIAALTITTTNLGYALNGWDHLFQSFFLTLATVLVLRHSSTSANMALIGICLGVAVLFRPDGIILASAILGAHCISLSRKKNIAYAGLSMAALIALALLVNYLQFGTLTPTTARLKLGASPSLDYSFTYLKTYTFSEYSAITLLIIFLGAYSLFHKISLKKYDWIIVFGCLITFFMNFYNSDVFGGGRMYWSSVCVMGAILSSNFPPIISNQYILSSKGNRFSIILLCTLFLFTSFYTLFQFPQLLKQKLISSEINSSKYYNSPIAQQLRVTHWIRDNLNPENGAIGYFYLGVSYHLPKFEIADFLGKADETIATSAVKWGPPGHNKWDINKTLEKWNLQAIVPTLNSDRDIPGALIMASNAVQKQDAWRYVPELLLNESVHKKFSYCYIRGKNSGAPEDKLGFFLRKDIASKYSNALNCH